MNCLIVYRPGNNSPIFYPSTNSDGSTHIRVEQRIPKDTFISINGATNHDLQDLTFLPDECPKMGVRVDSECWQYGSDYYTLLRAATGLRLDYQADELQADSEFLVKYLDALRGTDNRIQLYNVEVGLCDINLYFWHTEYKTTFTIVMSNIFKWGVDLYIPAGFYEKVPRYKVMVESHQAISAIGEEPHKYMLRLIRFFRTPQKENPDLTDRDPDFLVRMYPHPHKMDTAIIEYESSHFETTPDNLGRVIHNYHAGFALLPL